MAKKIKAPIITSRLIIDEFKTSDYARLKEIAFNINRNADSHAEEGYCPFYTFQVDRDTPDRDNVIRQKVADFLIKAERERKQEPRSTYRMALRLPSGYLIGNATVDMLPFEENGKRFTEIWDISLIRHTASMALQPRAFAGWFTTFLKNMTSWISPHILPTSFPANLLNVSAANRPDITRPLITAMANPEPYLKFIRQIFIAVVRSINKCRICSPS